MPVPFAEVNPYVLTQSPSFFRAYMFQVLCIDKGVT